MAADDRSAPAPPQGADAAFRRLLPVDNGTGSRRRRESSTMTSTIVKAADAAQFLSFVPRLLGYHPTRSLVVIPFHGSRSLGAMRFDLPLDEGDAVDRVASTVIGMVCRLPEADGVAAIVYCDETFGPGERMPHRRLADALERRADAGGLRVSDLLCVAADAWGSFVDPASPATGRPLSELVVVFDELADLPDPSGDQGTGAELPATDLAERERVGRSLLALGQAVELLCGDGDEASAAGVAESEDVAVATASADLATAPPPVTGEGSAGAVAAAPRIDPLALATVCRLDDLPTLFEDALGWDADALPPFDAAALVWCLSRPSLRDIALVQWSGTLIQGDEAFDAQLRWEAGEEYPAHLAMRMWGEGDRPDPERLAAALRLVRRVAAVAPRASRPGPLAMCAWLSWALGRSTHAEVYASQACEIEPEHGLSEIVLSFVRAGHLPDWAFRRAGAR